MKNLTYLLCLLVAMAGCKSDEPNPLLTGEWLWEGSSGGLGGASFNPKSTEQVVLRFESNKKFSLRRNDTLLYKGTFSLTTANSIYSGKDAAKIVTRQITVNKQAKNNQPIVVDGIILLLTAERLSTGDNHYDGYGSSFTRKS